MRRKMLSALLLLGSVCAWGQIDNCDARANPVQKTVKCSCTSTMLTITVCQSALGGGGQGCSDTGGGSILCNSSCGFISATGCIPGGPKSKPLSLSTPLERELKAIFDKGPELAVQTCGNDDGAAFEKWLLKTNSRHVDTAKAM